MIRIPTVLIGAAALAAAAALGACAPDPADGVPRAAIDGAAVSSDDPMAPSEVLGDPAAADPAHPGADAASDAIAPQPAYPGIEGAAAAVAPAASAGSVPLAGTIGFVGSKVTRSHDCSFLSWSGTLDPGEGTPETASLAFSVDTASIDCDPDESGPMHDRFHEHLRSEDFLAVEQHPQATFRSTSIAPSVTAPGTYDIAGELTIRGITRPIAFPAQVTIDGDAVSATAEFSLDRRDWELVYPGSPDDLIRDAFVMRIAVEGTR